MVAVVAPWEANNTTRGMDRGGLAYVIDAHTGRVRPLVGGVSLYYFSPSCGPGSTVALTRFDGQDQRVTELVSASAATATVRSVIRLRGEYTAAVPAPGGGFLAASGDAVGMCPGTVPPWWRGSPAARSAWWRTRSAEPTCWLATGTGRACGRR